MLFIQDLLQRFCPLWLCSLRGYRNWPQTFLPFFDHPGRKGFFFPIPSSSLSFSILHWLTSMAPPRGWSWKASFSAGCQRILKSVLSPQEGYGRPTVMARENPMSLQENHESPLPSLGQVSRASETQQDIYCLGSLGDSNPLASC